MFGRGGFDDRRRVVDMFTERTVFIIGIALAGFLAISPGLLLGGFDAANGTLTQKDLTPEQREAFTASDWAKRPIDLRGDTPAIHQIVQAENGALIIFGSFTGELTLGGAQLASVGGRDLFFAELSADGAWTRVLGFGGPGLDESATMVQDAERWVLRGKFHGNFSVGDERLTAEDETGPSAFELHIEAGGATKAWRIDPILLPPDGAGIWCGW